MRRPKAPTWREVETALRNQAVQLRDRVAALEAENARLRSEHVLRPLSEWHDDDGVALFWETPVEEPPYVGWPGDSGWPWDEDDDIVAYHEDGTEQSRTSYEDRIAWIPMPQPEEPAP